MTPEKVERTIDEARYAYHEGRPANALALLDRVKKVDMDDQFRARYLALRIASLEAAERAYDAKALVAKIISDTSASLLLLSTVADFLMDLGAPEHGVAIFRETARREPNEAGTHYNVALALRNSGDLEEAITVFRKAVEVDDGFYAAWCEMSQTYFRMQRLDDASETMRKYLELVPDDYVNWTALSVVDSMREDFERAEEAFERAEEIQPEYPELWYNRAQTAHRRGDMEQVRYCHERLADVAGDGWEEAMLRAVIHNSDEQPWQTWEALEDALDRVDARFEDSPGGYHPTRVHVYQSATALLAMMDLPEQHEAMRTRAIDRRMFDERVFDALRQFNGEPVSDAHVCSVLIAAKANKALKKRYSAPDVPGPAGYCRVYGVIATDEVEARSIVADFEKRVNEAAESNVKDVRLVKRDVKDECVGIASIRGIYFHSDEDITAAINQMAESMADDLQLPDEEE